MTAQSNQPGFMTDRTVLILLFVAAVSTMALLVLFAFAPELRPDASSDANAASHSAIGYAGLAEILKASGVEVRVDHGPAPGEDLPAPSLTILTPDSTTSPRDVAGYHATGPVLIVLPKWNVFPIILTPSWVMKDGLMNQFQLDVLLRPGKEFVIRSAVSGPVHTVAAAGAPAGMPEPVYPPIESLQTISGGNAVLTATGHGVLLSRTPKSGDPVYVLVEPDILNNHGLANAATARAALAIIAALRHGKGPVVLDVTLNGLGHTPSFLRALFDPEFLGATICALLAALLIGWHATSRFGAPLRGERVFALGKRALADNTANLIRMMGREGAMARRYVVSARDAAITRLGVRRGSEDEQNSLLAAIEASGSVTTPYDALLREAAGAENAADLLRIARKAHIWRQEISGGN